MRVGLKRLLQKCTSWPSQFAAVNF